MSRGSKGGDADAGDEGGAAANGRLSRGWIFTHLKMLMYGNSSESVGSSGLENTLDDDKIFLLNCMISELV